MGLLTNSRLRRFLGLFWPIFDSLLRGNIRKLILPLKRESKNWLKRTQKSTEAEIVNSPLSNKERLTPLLPWRELQMIDQQKARSEYGLFADRTTLLVFGGSQGAQFLNQSVPLALPSTVQVLHLTGKEERVEETKKAYRERNLFAVVKSFESNMEQAYAAVNGAICRSGAGTVAELIRYGVPAVLIPFPYANEHQRDNAEFLEKKVQGATMLLQEEKPN